jgi:hypothetical protein
MPYEDDGFDFEGQWTFVRQSDLAIFVRLLDGKRFAQTTMWVPKSVLHDLSEVYAPGTSGKLVVKTRWAEDNGYL